MDFMGMLDKFKDVQNRLKEVQESLGAITAEGESGGGMVKAKANGNKQLLGIEIDKELLKEEDLQMLQDLVVAAVNKAISNADEKAQVEIKKNAENMLPKIPGFNFGV